MAEGTKMETRWFASLEELGKEAAEVISARAEAIVRKRGVFAMALSGGKTPRPLYERLAEPPLSDRMPWPSIHLFWGDERVVPPDHPGSNFAMACQTLISKVMIPPPNVHRILGERRPEEAARAYEGELREFFGRLGQPCPTFDLILLGVGSDGHTASLFPGDGALEEEGWVATVAPQGSPAVARVTLTLPAINAARCILFLVSGSDKGEIVRAVLEHPEKAAGVYPAARVNPAGSLHWWIDGGSVGDV